MDFRCWFSSDVSYECCHYRQLRRLFVGVLRMRHADWSDSRPATDRCRGGDAFSLSRYPETSASQHIVGVFAWSTLWCLFARIDGAMRSTIVGLEVFHWSSHCLFRVRRLTKGAPTDASQAFFITGRQCVLSFHPPEDRLPRPDTLCGRGISSSTAIFELVLDPSMHTTSASFWNVPLSIVSARMPRSGWTSS